MIELAQNLEAETSHMMSVNAASQFSAHLVIDRSLTIQIFIVQTSKFAGLNDKPNTHHH